MIDEKRFKQIYKQGSTSTWEGCFEVFVDNETGVNYLHFSRGSAAGLTVLIDKDGKPLVTPIEE